MPEQALKSWSLLRKVKAKARVLKAKVKSAYTEDPHTPQGDRDSSDDEHGFHLGNLSCMHLHHVVFPHGHRRTPRATSDEATQEKKGYPTESVPVEQSSHGAIPTNTDSTLEPATHTSDGPAGLDQAISTSHNDNDDPARAHLPTDGVSHGELGVSAPINLKSESLSRTSDNFTLGPESPPAPLYSDDTASSKSGDRDAVNSQGQSDSENSTTEQDSRTGSGLQCSETLNQSVKHDNGVGLPQASLPSSPGRTPQILLQVEEYPTSEDGHAEGVEKENLGDKNDSDDVDVSDKNTPIAGDNGTQATDESGETILHRAYEGLAGAAAVAGGIAAATAQRLGLGHGDTSIADKPESPPTEQDIQFPEPQNQSVKHSSGAGLPQLSLLSSPGPTPQNSVQAEEYPPSDRSRAAGVEKVSEQGNLRDNNDSDDVDVSNRHTPIAADYGTPGTDESSETILHRAYEGLAGAAAVAGGIAAATAQSLGLGHEDTSIADKSDSPPTEQEPQNQSVKQDIGVGLPQSSLPSSPGRTPQNSLQVEDYPTSDHSGAAGVEKENHRGKKDSDDVDVSNQNTPIAADYGTPATDESSETILHRAYEGLAGVAAVAGGIAAATAQSLTWKHGSAAGVEEENLGYNNDSDDVDVSNRNTPIPGDYGTPATDESSETKPIHHRFEGLAGAAAVAGGIAAYEGLAGAATVAGGIAAATAQSLGLGQGDTSSADGHDSPPDLATREPGQIFSQNAHESAMDTENADAEKLPTEGSTTPSIGTDTSHTENAILGPQNTSAGERASETGVMSSPTDGSEPSDESGIVDKRDSSPDLGTRESGDTLSQNIDDSVVDTENPDAEELPSEGSRTTTTVTDTSHTGNALLSPQNTSAREPASETPGDMSNPTDRSEPSDESGIADKHDSSPDLATGESGETLSQNAHDSVVGTENADAKNLPTEGSTTPTTVTDTSQIGNAILGPKASDAAEQAKDYTESGTDPDPGWEKFLTEKVTDQAHGLKDATDHHVVEPLVDAVTESMDKLPDFWKSKWFGG